MANRKTGPKPLPTALKKRHPVMVKFDDGEFLRLKLRANHRPLASYVRERALA